MIVIEEAYNLKTLQFDDLLGKLHTHEKHLQEELDDHLRELQL